MKRIIHFTLMLLMFVIFTNQSGYSQVVVKIKPKRPKVIVVKKKAPGKNHVWISGHWKWSKSKHKYVWVRGKWHRMKKGHVWVDGHWKRVRKGYVWVPGHWRKR